MFASSGVGPSSSASGCGSAAHPCQTIGGALNAADGNAQNGDTVMVAAGTYVEQVAVNKAITLDGAGQGQTIIDAPAHGSLAPEYADPHDADGRACSSCRRAR